ncbi:MAG TPA: hypothetical protein VF886_05590 [Roseiarcus sp.]
MRVSRITTVVLGIVAIILGIIFEKISVASMVGLAFAVAASANFPAALDHVEGAHHPRRGDRRLRGPHQRAGADDQSQPLGDSVRLPERFGLFPFVSPALVTIPLSFFCCWLFSVTDSSKAATTEQAAFEAQYVRSQTGIGADAATVH